MSVERLFHEKRYYVLVSDVFKIPQCIMEGGGYYCWLKVAYHIYKNGGGLSGGCILQRR